VTSRRILAVTLARGGSKSIPKKNIRLLNGQPLIAHTIVEAKKSTLITRYIVSTDDPEIQSIAKRFGAEAPFLRPAELASDTATAVSADRHTLSWVENEEGVQYDYFIELMATNPMKTAVDIDAVLDKLISTNADSVIGMTRVGDHHPRRVKRVEEDLIKDFCLPEVPETHRQQLKPEAYIRNGSMYATTRSELISGRRYGTPNSRPYLMPADRSINIDEEVDFIAADYLVKKYRNDRFPN